MFWASLSIAILGWKIKIFYYKDTYRRKDIVFIHHEIAANDYTQIARIFDQ